MSVVSIVIGTTLWLMTAYNVIADSASPASWAGTTFAVPWLYLVLIFGFVDVHNGGAPTTPAAAARIWTVQSSGPGTQTLVWPVKSGQWSVVVMNATASSGVSVHADLGATFPPLPWVALGLDLGGVLLLAGSAALIIVPIRRATCRA